MSKRKMLIFNSLICSIFALNSHATSSHALLMTSSYAPKPLIYFSITNAQSWQEARIKNYPDSHGGSIDLASIFCTVNQHCITVGYSADAGGYILISNDSGESWEYKKLPIKTQGLYTTSCLGRFCFAGGNATRSQQATLLQSQDAGQSWQISPNITNTSLKKSSFETSACNSKICVVAGKATYQGDNKKPQLLALTSADQGKTWRHITIDNISSSDDATYSIYDSSCGNSGCMLLGKYIHESAEHQFILVGNENGTQWKYKQLAAFADGTFLYGLGYSKNSILVSGYNIKTKQAIILKSTDSGETWQPTRINHLSSDIVYSEIDKLSCKDYLCTAVGVVKRNNRIEALFLKSENEGETWDFNSSIYNFPEQGIDKRSMQLTCSNDACIALNLNNIFASWDGSYSWFFQDKNAIVNNRGNVGLRGAAFSKD